MRLTHDDPARQTSWPELTSYELRSSVLAEHFTEEDIFQLAEALALATDCEQLDLGFELQDLGPVFAEPLLATLAKAGVVIDHDKTDTANSTATTSSDDASVSDTTSDPKADSTTDTAGDPARDRWTG